MRGDFDFDPGRCKLVFKAGDRELLSEEFGWEDGKTHRFEFTENWQAGEQPLTFELEPLTPIEKKKTSVDMRIGSVVVEGPLEREHWARPKNFDRFFSKDDPGTGRERQEYAREVLDRFARKAFRRPVDERTLDRLAAIAEGAYQQPGKSVEQGLAEAMVAMLASPRFLFRVEDKDPTDSASAFSNVDEYALASRLSYFLWSTMPDDELFGLAERGELRKNLAAQVKRMLDDSRSEMLVRELHRPVAPGPRRRGDLDRRPDGAGARRRRGEGAEARAGGVPGVPGPARGGGEGGGQEGGAATEGPAAGRRPSGVRDGSPGSSRRRRSSSTTRCARP